ncbi:glycosyltransferase family 4 protein [Pseudomonadales bacterium]|nr:glycosyltransferase family 4 protein [Pseudomonadales bacterium]
MIFVHLYNDFSGSPRVLKSVIDAYSKLQKDSILFIGSDGDGVLDGCPVEKVKYFYPKKKNKIFVLIAYLLSQVALFIQLSRFPLAKNHDTIYVNSLLPFAAAIYGKLLGKKVIYHIHEVSLRPRALFCFLLFIANRCADKQIYVSKAHLEQVAPKFSNCYVVHNSISESVYQGSLVRRPQKAKGFSILMPASLRTYKGIDAFVKLSQLKYSRPIVWTLLLNDDASSVDNFRERHKHIQNLKIFDRVEDTSPFYSVSDLVVNLSYIDQWVETFGLTLVEAFAFGLPVIAPPVGGPLEIVDHNINGFLVDSYDQGKIVKLIESLLNDNEKYCNMSSSSLIKANEFLPVRFEENILKVILS